MMSVHIISRSRGSHTANNRGIALRIGSRKRFRDKEEEDTCEKLDLHTANSWLSLGFQSVSPLAFICFLCPFTSIVRNFRG
jgi:hypothetical protein